ncbi:MAG: hypothetical protein IIA67_12835 [Planctomycetes bacterium]|nr:hypothetical protein [Planctomycetota bacterium]
MTPTNKLETIRRIAQAHASPASNIGAHGLDSDTVSAVVGKKRWEWGERGGRSFFIPQTNHRLLSPTTAGQKNDT